VRPSVDKRVVFGLVVAVVLLGWFTARLNWIELRQALSDASVPLVLASTVVMIGEWGLRPVRWILLIRPVSTQVGLRDLWIATVAGAAVNTLLPLRGGDIVRPAVVARRTDVPFTTALSTTVVERIFDLFGVIGMLVIMLVLVPGMDHDSSGVVGDLRRGGITFGVLALVLIGAVVFLGQRGAKAWVWKVLLPVPRRTRVRIYRLFSQLVAGLVVTGSPLRLAGAMAVTVVIWANGLLSILLVFWAFGLDLPVAAALFVELALAVSITVPQAPGFLGLFQVVMEEALTLWGAQEGAAEAIALVFWVVCFVPITSIGAWATWREGVSLFATRDEVVQGARGSQRRPSAD